MAVVCLVATAIRQTTDKHTHGGTDMSRSTVVDQEGNSTHVVETSADGSMSKIYDYDPDPFNINDNKGELVTVVEHHPNGTSTAYDPPSAVDEFIGLQTGEKRS